jgi:hypothetical protein
VEEQLFQRQFLFVVGTIGRRAAEKRSLWNRLSSTQARKFGMNKKLLTFLHRF